MTVRKKTRSGSERLRHMLGTTEQRTDREGLNYQSGQIINAVNLNYPKQSSRYRNPIFTQRSKGALASKQRP